MIFSHIIFVPCVFFCIRSAFLSFHFISFPVFLRLPLWLLFQRNSMWFFSFWPLLSLWAAIAAVLLVAKERTENKLNFLPLIRFSMLLCCIEWYFHSHMNFRTVPPINLSSFIIILTCFSFKNLLVSRLRRASHRHLLNATILSICQCAYRHRTHRTTV